jgi:hypothetical protein
MANTVKVNGKTYNTADKTETIRRLEVALINTVPGSREDLETRFPQVWDPGEMERDFIPLGFMAPYIVVERKEDNKKGSLQFQHRPRFYFNFSLD